MKDAKEIAVFLVNDGDADDFLCRISSKRLPKLVWTERIIRSIFIQMVRRVIF